MPTLLSRRNLIALSPALILAKTKLSSAERVKRALNGQEVDHAPISLWHHFNLEKEGPERHAEQTLSFHRQYQTDFVKVMSDFPYPKPSGNWWELREEKSPYAPQLLALKRIAAGLSGQAPFVETIFNPWNVAEKLSSKDEVQKLKRENPDRLLSALAVIARSEANHARLALATGASGIFLAIANADSSVLSREDYLKFSAPFDKIVLEAAKSAPLNVLHIHGAKVYLDLFADQKAFPAAVLNYSVKTTSTPLSKARAKYSGVLAGGIDEVNYRGLSKEELLIQAKQARSEAGAKFFLTPGCSVPNEATPQELSRLAQIFA